MKKSCFLSSVIVLTFVIGVGYYVIQNYGDQLLSIGKKKITEFVTLSLEDEIEDLHTGQYNDSLKVMLADFIERTGEKSGKKFEFTLNNFVDSVKYFIEDKFLDSLEFLKLKNIVYRDERSKKN